MKYHKDMWDKLLSLKSKLVSVCEHCDGIGYHADGKMCKCMLLFRYLSKLVISRIPPEYWALHYKSLEVKPAYINLLKTFFEHFQNARNKALGIFYMGENGVGKTAMMCEVGKFAVQKGYSVKYFTIEEFVNAARQGNVDTTALYESADILLIDELGKVYSKEGSTYVIDTVESFIRRNITQKMLILSTNFSLKELSELLGDSTMSVMQRHLKFVEVEGSDYSPALQDAWKDALASEVNFYDKNILQAATRFAKQMEVDV